MQVEGNRWTISHGFAVAAFASAEQFLESDQPYRAACLIVDVSMPGISGLRLHQRLLEAGYRIPTIVITGRPTAADRDEALGAGVLSYLPKPFSERQPPQPRAGLSVNLVPMPSP